MRTSLVTLSVASLSLALAGCAPLPARRGGDCIPIEPLPGYRTCAVAEPPFSYGALPAGVRVEALDTSLPAQVDLRDDPALAYCLVVEDQGATGWCQTVSTTTALEATECVACAAARAVDPSLGAPRVSILHARWSQFRDGRRPFTQSELNAGTSIADAAGLLASVGATGERELPSLFTLDAINDAIGEGRPSDYPIEHRASTMTVLPPGASIVDGLRRALADRRVPVVGVPFMHHVGWNSCDASPGHVAVPPGTTSLLSDVPTCGGSECDRGAACMVRTDEGDAFHAVALVGYDDDAEAFVLLNSWGTRWADGGFGTLSYEFVARWARYGVTLDGMHPSVAGACAPTPPHVDRCRIHTSTCGACTLDPGCGWCAAGNTCMEAVEGQGQPRHGDCTEWYGTQLACTAPALQHLPCPSGACDACVRVEGCGWAGEVGHCFPIDEVPTGVGDLSRTCSP